MTVLLPILIIALTALVGFYFMDHCGKFMEEHYNGSPDISVFRKEKKKTTCDTILPGIHIFRKG